MQNNFQLNYNWYNYIFDYENVLNRFLAINFKYSYAFSLSILQCIRKKFWCFNQQLNYR